MLDEFVAPLVEGRGGLALPLNPTDVAFEFLGRFFDRVLGVPQSLARRLQVLRSRGLDQVDHGVQVVALEVRPAQGTEGCAAEGGRLHHTTDRVDDAGLLGDLLLLRLVRVLVLLFVTH
ncbi:hypothetical protein ABT063_09845 [Streptomyces sp. NPDC002838]|uniref:hypothetical protein n=1 Tax=Streptomyces sp. NPDC002838 TaxID=3154436 RepID=UPI00332FDB34